MSYGLRNSELSTCLFQFSHKTRQTMLLYGTLILLPKSILNANLTTTNRFFTNDDWQRGRFENFESDHQYNRISNRTYDSKSNRITKLRRSLVNTVDGQDDRPTEYASLFTSAFTAGKFKMWTSCDSVSLRNGHDWTSTWSTTQSNSGINVFTLVWLQRADISNMLWCANLTVSF